MLNKQAAIESTEEGDDKDKDKTEAHAKNDDVADNKTAKQKAAEFFAGGDKKDPADDKTKKDDSDKKGL